jgi:Fe-S-cluster containining protein
MHQNSKEFTESPDWAYWQAMPDEVRQRLISYYRGMVAGEVENREAAEVPCLWLDEATGRCRHYEFRPEACRVVLEPGDELCMQFRAAEGLAT